MTPTTTTNKNQRYRPRKFTTSNKNVVIADSSSTDQIKEIICPNQNCGLIIHTRKSQGDLTCPHCLFEFEVEKTRKRSKLETPRGRDIETLVSTTPLPGYGDIAIKRPPVYKRSLAEMAKRGIKITSYDVRDGAGRPIREEGDDS
jgi:hypothetical protein